MRSCVPGLGHRRALRGLTQGVTFRFAFQTGHSEGNGRQTEGLVMLRNRLVIVQLSFEERLS